MADNQISRRAKANLPTVLLTLLSIVQALALELMWTHLGEQPYLYTWSFIAFLSWLQIGATFLGIVEFANISALGPNKIGLWFVLLGVLFAAMAWVSQVTMRRARLDGDNEEFFSAVAPAIWRDHLRSIIPAAGLMILGAGFWLSGNEGWIALIAIVGVVMLLLLQIRLSHKYTQRSYIQG